MNQAMFVIDLIILSSVIYLLLSFINSKDIVISFIILLLSASAIIIATNIVLSPIKYINPLSVIVAHLTVLIVVYLLKIYRVKVKILSDSSRFVGIEPSINYKDQAGLFAVFIIFIVLMNLLLALYFPPNNWDSMTYHLARVAQWMQNGSIRHFPTYESRQLYSAPNSEMLILWTMVFLKSDVLANAIQWIMYISLGAGIYKMATLMDYTRPASLFAACLFLGLPEVILQSSTTQNDLVVTFFLFSWFLLFIYGAKRQKIVPLIFSGLALGLAVGTKGTVFYAAPAFIVVVAVLVTHYRIRFKQLLVWVGACIIGVLLLGSYNYLLNYSTFGNILSDPSHMERIRNGSFLSSLCLYLYQMIDPAGLPQVIAEPLMAFKISTVREFADVPSHIIPGITALGIHEDCNWFGPVGFISIIVAVFQAVKSGRKEPLKWCLLFVVVGFTLSLAYLQAWSPWKGRYFILPMAFIAPLMASVYPSNRNERSKKIITYALILLTAWISLYVILFNQRKPIHNFKQVVNMSSVEKRVVLGGFPRFMPAALLQYALIDDGSRVGLAFLGDAWTYLYFGDNINRIIIQIPALGDPTDVDEILHKYNLDWLILDSGRNDIIGTNRDYFIVSGRRETKYHMYFRNSNYGDGFDRKIRDGSINSTMVRGLLDFVRSGSITAPPGFETILEEANCTLP